MIKQKALLFYLFIFIILFACSKRKVTYTIEENNGIRNIVNHALQWGSNQKITLEFIRKVGELEAEDEHFLLFKPRDCVRDS